MKAGSIKFKENVTFERIDKKTGKVLSKSTKSNIITNAGLESIAKRIFSGDVNVFKYIAIGTSNTAASATDTVLGGEVAREQADVTYTGNGKVKFTKRFSFGTGEEHSIIEAGIFNAETNGTMLNRVVDDVAKEVDNEVDLTVTIEITAARA